MKMKKFLIGSILPKVTDWLNEVLEYLVGGNDDVMEFIKNHQSVLTLIWVACQFGLSFIKIDDDKNPLAKIFLELQEACMNIVKDHGFSWVCPGKVE